jgi:hypothetical protein
MAAVRPRTGFTPAPHRPSGQPVEKEPLQVRIPVAVKRRFKSHAALRGLEPHELFVEVWERYEASLPQDAAKDGDTGRL